MNIARQGFRKNDEREPTQEGQRERGGNGGEQLNNARASAFGAVVRPPALPCVAFLACQNSILEEGKEEGDRAGESWWEGKNTSELGDGRKFRQKAKPHNL